MRHQLYILWIVAYQLLTVYRNKPENHSGLLEMGPNTKKKKKKKVQQIIIKISIKQKIFQSFTHTFMFRRRNLISASSWKTRLVSVTFSIPSEPFFRKGFVQPHSSDTSTKLSTSASNTTVTSQYHGLLHYHKAAASHQKILCSSIKIELKWKQHLLLKSNLYRIIFHYGRLSKILLLSFINNEKAKSNKTKMPLFFHNNFPFSVFKNKTYIRVLNKKKIKWN